MALATPAAARLSASSSRAIADLMPAAPTLPLAADAIRQAAADLDRGGEAQQAVEQALVAVGLPPPQPVR